MKIKKYIISILLLLFSSVVIYAYTDLSDNFDKSLVQGIEYSYKEPRKILFVQIEGRYNELALSSKEFLDTVYYYSIIKLKLGHTPFHYAVDESGNVYKTGQYDVTQITDEPYLVIAYLSNNGQLNNKASRSIAEITETLSREYGLSEYEVHAYNLVEKENSFSELQLTQANDLFVESIKNSLTDWNGYDREHLDYKAEVVSVESTDSVQVGDLLKVKVVIKNKNDFIWTSDKYPIYVSVKDSKDSVFAVNEVWDSFNKTVHVSSDMYVLPDQEIELEFEIDPKVKPGDYSETFTLLKFNGEPFVDSEFSVDFTVIKGDQELIQIDSPEAGYVNIRECRRFSCKQVDVVNDGEVYPVVEYHESCWYKIRYAEGKEGWFYCPYAKEVD
jgi:hypothetical protein